MNIISHICFIISFSSFLTFFRKRTDIFAPGRLFILVWSIAIGVTNLKLSRYQFEWSYFSWTMLLITIISFLLGVFIVFVINSDKKIKKIETIRPNIFIPALDDRLLFKYILILFLTYIVSFFISYLVIGYVPIFTKYPGLFRVNWGIFGFGLFIQAFPSLILLMLLYFFISKGHKFNKFILFNLFLITFVTYGLLLQRYYIIFAIIVFASILYYSTKLFRFRNLTIMLAIIVSIIYSMSYIRMTTTITNYLYYLSDMKYSIKYAIFTEPYMYIVMNLENFANAVNKLEKFTYGIFTFDFVFALTGIKHPIAEYLNINNYPHLITSSYNTFTMFFIYYQDFGALGLFVCPLFLGMLISTFYYKMRVSPNINTVTIYSIFVFIILFSFFVPLITFLHFIFNFIVLYYITKKIINNKTVNS